MTLKSVEYICPTMLILIIIILKLTIDEKLSFENCKRLAVEATVDIMSLATSFVITFLIGCVAKDSEKASVGILNLVLCFFFLVVVVASSKANIRKYAETEKRRYLFFGIVIGYAVSLFFYANQYYYYVNCGRCSNERGNIQYMCIDFNSSYYSGN